MSALRRTATDKFSVQQALTLEQLEVMSLPEIEKVLLPVHQVVPSIALRAPPCSSLAWTP